MGFSRFLKSCHICYFFDCQSLLTGFAQLMEPSQNMPLWGRIWAFAHNLDGSRPRQKVPLWICNFGDTIRVLKPEQQMLETDQNPDATLTPAADPSLSRWPHRIGVLLTMIVFPLIWLGGLVTSWDAGMAVPDWPGTYGYNMFAYPPSTWFFGPWDLFVEHGHRQLASIAGFVSIALMWTTFRNDPRRWVKWYSVALFLLVGFQGLLGGIRVLSDRGSLGDWELMLSARAIARVHGCIGPLFFMAVVGFCVVTSRWWFQQNEFRNSGASKRSFISTWPVLMMGAAYAQLMVGACLRHISEGASHKEYVLLVAIHIMTAVGLVVGTMFQGMAVWRATRKEPASKSLVGSVRWLVLGIVVQFCLGLGTWVVKFGWPVWFENQGFAAGFVVSEKSLFQMNLITAHVAVGSLILAFWTVQVFRSQRLFAPSLFGKTPAKAQTNATSDLDLAT